MYTFLLPVAMILILTTPAFANDNIINAAHLDNKVSCADCHDTETPQKRAPARLCIECHSEIPGSIKQYSDGGVERSVNVHNSHDGKLRCTLCHQIHKPSNFYCNQCHKFQISVP